jgi:mono/diheme cytochrome c family protein
MSSHWIVCTVAMTALLTATGCTKPDGAQASQPASAPADDKTTATTGAAAGNEVGEAKAKEIFKSRCATCHGPDGRGNGPGAITLNPKPRNYHDKEWQSKVTDEEITKAIVYGGAAIGKSPAMPSNPDLDEQPQTVAALLHIVRDFGK